jgi:hypothetical protein
MANDSQKSIIAQNRKVLRIWIVISVIVTLISAFVIFFLKRGKPQTQNIKTFFAGLALTITGFVLVFRAIRVYGSGKNIMTKGDLSGNSKQLLDVIGVGLVVEFVGIWWSQAAFLFFLIPAFIIYELLKKLSGWLSAV